ncbi:Mbeg1-like protein [uncultured Streptococcus sp.]|uniref:Mbeg1-like protein n=1 Tax=uncultured Streptococcus sp. TaxID=83427 RepID=UPI0028DB8AC9|nr:Mbeg1-like protein [uncultured Streptococcus sp.]
MPNLIDYLEKVTELTFDQEPLNILDKVCINEIGYLPYEKWLTASELQKTINLHDYVEGKDLNLDYSFMVTKERVKLAEAMVRSRRFAGLNLSNYRSVLDKEVEKQFAAMIFSLPELDYQQIVFRGTDDSVIGWKEDFQLTYSREISAHRSALAFLSEYLPNLSGHIIVSGHSKGGNLALYSAVQSSPALREQIAELLLLDSPGLMKSLLEKPSYQELKAKMTVIRPQDSVVGVMLYWDMPAQLVAAEGIGFAQHNALTWEVDLATNDFVHEEQPTELSQRLEETFQKWIETLPNQQLKQVFDLFFDTILDSGIESLDDIGIKALPKLGQLLQEFGNLTNQQKKVLQDGFKQLLWIFWKSGNKKTNLPKLELPDFIKKLNELRNHD